MAAKQRNGMIDLMRMICALFVCCFHVWKYYLQGSVSLGMSGRIAVEYFFVLSGFLLAASAEKSDKNAPVWLLTWQTMKRRISGIFPAWSVALMMSMAVSAFQGGFPADKILRMIEKNTTSYLMLTDLGLPDGTIIRFSWYIPTMLLCMMILCPLLMKNRKGFTYTAAPVAVIIGFICLFQLQGTLLGEKTIWLGFIQNWFIRALSEMCLGVIAFEFSRWLTERLGNRLTHTGRTLITAAELGTLSYALIKMTFGWTNLNILGIVLCFAAFIALAYANLGWTGCVVKGKFWMWLGKFSLSLYLGHGITHRLLEDLWGAMHPGLYILLYFGAAFACALIIHYSAQLLVFLYRKAKVRLAKVCLLPEEG